MGAGSVWWTETRNKYTKCRTKQTLRAMSALFILLAIIAGLVLAPECNESTTADSISSFRSAD